MKNSIRRLILSILAGILFMTHSATALNADSPHYLNELSQNPNVMTHLDQMIGMQTTIPRMMDALLAHPEYLGLTSEDVSEPETIQLQTPFFVPMIRGNHIEDNLSSLYYPITNKDGSLLAFAILIKHSGDLSSTISIEFAPVLDEFLKNRAPGSVAVVSYEGLSLMAVDSSFNVVYLDGTHHQVDPERLRSTLEEVFIKRSVEMIARQQGNPSARLFPKPMNAKEVAELYSSETNAMAASFYRDKIEPHTSDVDAMMMRLAAAQASASQTRSTVKPSSGVGDYLDGYQTVTQGTDPICWAATIASMVRWERPDRYPNITARQVYLSIRYDQDYTGAHDWEEPLDVLKILLGSTYFPKYLTYYLDESSVRTVINNEDPAYMSAQGSITGRHATALCGYLSYSDGSFVVRVMDPNQGAFRLSDRSYSNMFRYQSGGQFFYWDSTIRLLYS